MSDAPDVVVNTGTRCPICERGILIAVGYETWDCSRSACNNQFYYDWWRGCKLLNARNKPGFTFWQRFKAWWK